jgi:uncharacterized protein
LKELAKILAYFVAVILLGALLAPPLYWAGQGLAARGVLAFLAETDFQKFFNRAMLVAALVLLWPVVRWLRIGGWSELGLEPNPRRWKHLTAGFLIAGLFVAVMAGCYIAGDVYRWKKKFDEWERIPVLFLSAWVIALLEEGLFRAGILGLFRRTLPAGVAIAISAAVFSSVHFLKPDDAVQIAQVGWLSGFELVPHVFHKFAEPMELLSGFTTILVLGLMLADVTVRTRSIWMAIGLHAGVVFVKMSFSKLTKRDEAHLPWIGEELQLGLVPVGMLLLAWLAARLWLRYVDTPGNSQSR